MKGSFCKFTPLLDLWSRGGSGRQENENELFTPQQSVQKSCCGTGIGVSLCPSGSFYRHCRNLSEGLRSFRPFGERLKKLRSSPSYSFAVHPHAAVASASREDTEQVSQLGGQLSAVNWDHSTIWVGNNLKTKRARGIQLQADFDFVCLVFGLFNLLQMNTWATSVKT
jgi:hypothetical protein